MRRFVVPGLVLMLFGSFSSAQSNQQSEKHEPSAILASARYVYIEPYEGAGPPEDREDLKVATGVAGSEEILPRRLHAEVRGVLAVRRLHVEETQHPVRLVYCIGAYRPGGHLVDGVQVRQSWVEREV